MTILCEPSAERVESLAGHIEGSVLRVTGINSVNDALAANPSETVVVLGAGVEMEQALEFTVWLRQQRPAVRVVLLRESLQVSDLTAAMRAGVREVLPADDREALLEACRRYQHVFGSVSPETPAASPRGHVLTVFSAKGGCGKTTIATNLAVTLNQAGQRVCLVDLDLAFGDVAITLQLTPTHTIVDVAALGGALDEQQVSSLLTPHLPGLDCVLAPVVPGDAERVPATLTAALIDVLAGMYDYVVIDTPAQITEHVLAALDASHQHILLTTPEIPALKNLRLTLDMLDLLAYEGRSRTIVLNRSDEQVGLSEADIERVVRSPISGRIPSSRDVPISINRGVSIAAQSPDHPVSVAIRQFVASHVHHAPEPAAPRRARRSALGFRRRSS
jgi:Flp pilus assembly CpaE family ATPase